MSSLLFTVLLLHYNYSFFVTDWTLYCVFFHVWSMHLIALARRFTSRVRTTGGSGVEALKELQTHPPVSLWNISSLSCWFVSLLRISRKMYPPMNSWTTCSQCYKLLITFLHPNLRTLFQCCSPDGPAKIVFPTTLCRGWDSNPCQ